MGGTGAGCVGHGGSCCVCGGRSLEGRALGLFRGLTLSESECRDCSSVSSLSSLSSSRCALSPSSLQSSQLPTECGDAAAGPPPCERTDMRSIVESLSSIDARICSAALLGNGWSTPAEHAPSSASTAEASDEAHMGTSSEISITVRQMCCTGSASPRLLNAPLRGGFSSWQAGGL